MTAGPAMGPWHARHGFVLTAGSALGLAAVVVAWFGASGEATTSRQLIWVAIGAAGIAVSGAANAVWLLAGRRAVGVRRVAGVVDPARSLSRERADRAGSVELGLVVAGGSMTHYHRPDCVLVAGKPVQTGTAGELAEAGRTPCGVCAP